MFAERAGAMSVGIQVVIVMGSQSDWRIMEGAARALDEFKIPYVVEVVSARR